MAIALSGERDVLTVRDFGLHSVPARTSVFEMQSAQAIPLPATANFDEAISQFEFTLLNNALRECAGNKTVAAERLGIKRTTLIMKLKNLEKAQYSPRCGRRDAGEADGGFVGAANCWDGGIQRSMNTPYLAHPELPVDGDWYDFCGD